MGQRPDRYARTRELHQEALGSLAGGVSSNFRLGAHPVPLTFERASGAELVDVDGNHYLDYALGMGPAILGHAPPGVLDAVRASLDDGQLYAGQHLLELRLAQRLQSVVPCAELVRFGMSGTEMVQAALRLARAATGRRTVVKFEGHYHGWLDNVFLNVAASSTPPGDAVPLVAQSAGQVLPSASDVVVLPWNDASAVTDLLRADGAGVAAVLMEPVMCNTSVIVPRPGYLEAVRAACDDAGALLVFDEVITGFRVALGGAQQAYGVTPDLAVFAKALGGGFPIAALAGRAEVMDLTGTAGGVVHGGTYNANTTSSAAGLATLTALQADEGAAHRTIERVGALVMDGVRTAGGPHGLCVQGLPSVFSTAFSEEASIDDARGYARADGARQQRFLRLLQDEGVRTTSRGTWFVSAAHTEDDASRTVEAVERALAGLDAPRRRDAVVAGRA